MRAAADHPADQHQQKNGTPRAEIFMSDQSTITARLAFNLIDKDTVATLAENKPFILAALPPVLDEFYDHVVKFSETSKFFKNRDHMMHAKQMQLNHWTIIASGRFDQTYEASVTKIGEVHNKLGLEPRWYIGGYNFLVSSLIGAIASKLPTSKF